MARYEDFRVTNLNVDKILPTGQSASGAGLSPGIWGDCPILTMKVDPTLGIFTGDNFTSVMATGFPYLITGTNGTFTSLAASAQGVARALTAGADNDECEVSYNNNVAGLIKAAAANNWWFEARVKIKQITVAQGIFVGLAEEAGVADNFLADDTMALADKDYIGFSFLAATDIAPAVRTIMRINGGSEKIVKTGIMTAAAATWYKLGMKHADGRTKFYINGAPLADSVLTTASNYPLNQVMCPTFAVKSGDVAGTTNYLDIDWWYGAQLR